MDFPIYSYPTGQANDPKVLQNSLGSFWNKIFREKLTVQGYTMGMAEELTQMYYDLVDSINSFSVFKIAALNKEKWYPIVIKRSQFNKSPLLFQPNDAVFGPQPATDQFYQDITFQFGLPKSPNENIYSVAMPADFAKFSIVTNRVIGPSVLYVNGIDVTMQLNTLYFNSNLFNDSRIPQYDIVNDAGVPSTFVDPDGNTVEDQYIVLWAYHSEIDNNALNESFGYIFGLNLPSTEESAAILRGLVKFSVGGPTIGGLISAMGAFAGIQPVIEDTETVEYISYNQYSTVVATDLNVYTFDPRLNLVDGLAVGSVVHAADILVDAIQYYDTSVLPNWWQTVFKNDPKVAFSSSIFLGSYNFQLFFKNTIDLVTLSESNVLNFPVEGDPDDVATFNAYLNQSENIEQVKAIFGLNLSPIPAQHITSVPIVPMDFLFNNFFKDNTALLKIHLYDTVSTAAFLSYIDLITDMLPPHVYLLFDIELDLPVDAYENLNGSYSIASIPNTTLNADGSDASGNIASVSPYFYKDLATRLFAIGKAPVKNSKSLIDASNLDQTILNATTGGQAYAIAGKCFTHIPTGATTRTVQTLKIIDFSSPYS